MPAKIRTSGQLRAFLCDTMTALRTGECDIDAAAKITKLATQVNESFYAEVKVNNARAEMGEAIDKFGTLGIGALADDH